MDHLEAPPALYPPVDPQRRPRGGLADEVVAYVRDLVLTGALRPGTKLDQEAISHALGVSRSPIREALVTLGHEGLLDVTPRRGAAVARLTPEDIIDHYELFGVVSGRAAAVAADVLKAEECDRLSAIHDRFVDGTTEDLSALNYAFHHIINTTAPRRTRWLLRHLEKSVPATYYEFAEGWEPQAFLHHDAILTAIVGRQPEAARLAMEHHLHESGVAAVAFLDKQGFWHDIES